MQSLTRMTWKHVIVALAVAMIAALSVAVATFGSSGATRAGGQLTGSWLVSVNLTKPPGGGKPLSYKSLITFTSDKTLLAAAWLPKTRATGNGNGVWAATGNGRFTATIMLVWLEGNLPVSINRGKATLTLSGANAFSGPFHVDVLDSGGKVLASGGGNLRGSRLQAG